MKKNEEMKSMTMSEVLDALNTAVDAYNEATEPSKKVNLEVEAKKLSEQYNELSKLTVYAEALKAEMPVVAIIKKHHYGTYAVQYKVVTDIVEGKSVAKKVGSIKAGNKAVDMFDFIIWAEAKNKKVAAATDWRTKLNAQRTIINSEFDKAVKSDENYTVSKGTAAKVLQNVFDALIFVPGESGKNAIFPNKDCKNLIITCAAEYKEIITESDDVDTSLGFFKDKRWKSTIQSALFLVLKNKTLTYTFGDPEAEANDATITDSKEATKAEAEAK